MGKQLKFGIDLGGTKTEIIGLETTEHSLSDNTNAADLSVTEVFRHRVATKKDDYPATLTTIKELVELAEQKLGLSGSLGLAIPGAISAKTGKIKNANSTWLIGQDLQGDLQRMLQRPVALSNDANCFALSEATDGAAQGAKVVFGVIIGTGCGGGIVVDGKILNGINAIGGEWGHNPLPWQTSKDHALDCYCGLQGCNETYLSGTGFAKHYQGRTGKTLTAKEIVALSESGDELAEELMQDYVIWLAKGLASVINVIDPDVIVLGGGMSNIQRLYDEVPKIWHKWVFSDRVDTILKPPKFGDSSGVRGAAWL